MGYSNGIITAPVSISDIRDVLGAGSNDLGTLCQSERINMWARFKPVKNSKVHYNGQLNDGAYTWNRSAENPWWKGRYGNCGIISPVMPDSDGSTIQSKLEYCLSKATEKNAGYSHDYPTGGSTNPYRQSDFLQYNHRATFPVYMIDRGSADNKHNFDDVIRVCVNARTSTSPDAATCLCIDEISAISLEGSSSNNVNLGDCYIGIVAKDSSGLFVGNDSGLYWKTSDSKIKDMNGNFNVEFKGSTLTNLAGNYTIYAFICNSKKPNFDNGTGMEIPAIGFKPYPIPDATYQFSLTNNAGKRLEFNSIKLDRTNKRFGYVVYCYGNSTDVFENITFTFKLPNGDIWKTYVVEETWSAQESGKNMSGYINIKDFDKTAEVDTVWEFNQWCKTNIDMVEYITVEVSCRDASVKTKQTTLIKQ